MLMACQENYSPKPYGYFRVDLPAHSYSKITQQNLPYSFDISSIAKITQSSDFTQKNWIDIDYQTLNAKIHCSYFVVDNNLQELLEDSYRYVYKHVTKADGIIQQVYENPDARVYGILYDLEGNTASSLQFVLTDSIHHFFRAALYFDNKPNADSIAPMNEYIRDDMFRLVESFEWKR